MTILKSVRGFISSYFQHEKCSLIFHLFIDIKFVSFGWAHTKLHSCQVGCMAMFELELKSCINQVLHILLQMTKHVILTPCLPLWSFLKCPKQNNFPTLSCSHIWHKKKKYASVQNMLILLSLTCQHSDALSTSFILAKTHQACHQDSTKCGLWPHPHFAHKLPNMPLNGFFHLGKNCT